MTSGEALSRTVEVLRGASSRGVPTCVQLVGPPGVGRWTLARDICSSLRRRGWLALPAAGRPALAGSPYGVLGEGLWGGLDCAARQGTAGRGKPDSARPEPGSHRRPMWELLGHLPRRWARRLPRDATVVAQG